MADVTVIYDDDLVTVNVSECDCEDSSSNVDVIVITATDTNSYTSATLIGKSLLLVFIDNLIRIPSEYTFNDLTGNIVFDSPVDTGSIIQILYK